MITLGESIPSYSEAGRAARDIFWDIFNDVNFYVEDEDQENLYFEILGKLFPNIKISQIFPLGGKNAVIAHAVDPANAGNARKSIYIVDKDFDDLLGNIFFQKNVFYLSLYCIENYLLEEPAVVQISVECEPKRKRVILEKEIGYIKFIKQSINSLTPLFQLFFVVQKFNLGIKNCDRKPEEFSVDKATWLIDAKKVASYATIVVTKLLDNRIFKDAAECENYINNVFAKESVHGSNISGKFILALTYHYLRSKVKLGNTTFDSLLYRLACNGTLEKLSPLKKQIQNYLE